MMKTVATFRSLVLGVAMLACGAGCTAAVESGEEADVTEAPSRVPTSARTTAETANDTRDNAHQARRVIGESGPQDEAREPGTYPTAPPVPVPVPFVEPAPWTDVAR